MMPWPLSVPVLSDGTVTLRAHVPGDLDPMLEMAVDPVTVQWTSIPVPYSREHSEQFALHDVPRGWDEGTWRGWAVEVDGRFAGNVDVRGRPVADLGFALHPWARGRGVMAAAVRLAVDWALTEGETDVVHWRANVGNVASLRVAHAAGFTLHGTTPRLLHQRGQLLDAWTGSFGFGDVPLPRTSWVGDAVLKSDRLRLRPFGPGDIERLVEASTDPETRHWIAGLPSPYTRADAERFLADAAWRAATGDRATWCVADPATDRLLGRVDLADLHALGGDGGEIAYWTHPDARGQGLTSEAVRLVIDHAFSALGRRRLTLYAAAGNQASHAIATGNGFTAYGTQTAAEPLGDGTYADLVGYELLAP
jgi:RimJ/RimL family protein N-acetyltransferase